MSQELEPQADRHKGLHSVAENALVIAVAAIEPLRTEGLIFGEAPTTLRFRLQRQLPDVIGNAAAIFAGVTIGISR